MNTLLIRQMVMGSLVSITSYIVKHSNNNLKITFLDGLGNLLGLIIAMMLNNIVTQNFIVSTFVYYNYCSET